MTDDEAEREAWRLLHVDSHECSVVPSWYFTAGWAAGLSHARKESEQRIAALERVAKVARPFVYFVPVSNRGYLLEEQRLLDALRELDQLKDSGSPGSDSKSHSEASSSGDASFSKGGDANADTRQLVTSAADSTSAEVGVLTIMKDSEYPALSIDIRLIDALRREGFLTRADLARIARKAASWCAGVGDDDERALSYLADAAESEGDDA